MHSRALQMKVLMKMNRETSRPNLDWLKRYYIVRALFSALWVVLALALGKAHPALGLGLIIAYPAWDSLANYVDAQRSGGLRSNPTQMVNVLVSAIVTLAVAGAATRSFHAVIAVVGVWATLAGILQLSTAARRWRSASAQWPMILSGAQSALAGLFFIAKANEPVSSLSVADVAPYAAFGAFYFAVAAFMLFRRSAVRHGAASDTESERV